MLNGNSNNAIIAAPISSDEDIAAAISFLNTVLPHPLDREIWNWECGSFPETSVLTFLKSGNEAGGTQLMLPFPLETREGFVLSGKCENSYLHADCRGKGLFEELFAFATVKSKEKGMKLLWAFTPATRVYGGRLGFTCLENSMAVSRGMLGFPGFTAAGGPGKNPLKKLYRVARTFMRVYRQNRLLAAVVKSAAKSGESEYKAYNLPVSFGDISSLYSRLCPEDVRLACTESFFHWRITGNINLNYRHRFYYRNGRLEGYFILAIKGNSANITAFTASDEQLAKRMFADLITLAKKDNLIHYKYFGNSAHPLNARFFSIMSQAGAEITPDPGMPFVFKSISENLPALPETSAGWYLNGLWTEGFTY